ncbi:poly-ribose polymerase [Lasallia pustulata]|uniref:Poly [ADP-ribose] polymerase n=1 Tax=Lasallia pustulata TaxID=136370 RepID=A0A1W5CTL7_9LECA|nr:poly-ribose polymerase [Lasallia pustulata]
MGPSFKDFTIALSGSFPGQKQANLINYINSNGGKHSAKVTDSCTHLVTSQKDFDNPSPKVKQASDRPNTKIVSLEWLLDSVEAKKKVKETQYLVAATPKSKDITNGKKRARAESVGNDKPSQALDGNNKQEPPAKKQKHGQKAKSESIRIPIDEGCPLDPDARVYIDDTGVIYDAALNQTNVGNNNNKFYRIQVLGTSKTYKTWTRWGRVGEHGQSAILGDDSLDDAIRQFEKKFKDKTGHNWANRLDGPKKNKYTFLERNYEEDSSEDEKDLPGAGSRRGSKKSLGSENKVVVESTLPKPVQRLMQLIFNQAYFDTTMMEMSYDANKLPLGKLSKRTLKTGFERLKELAELLANPALADEQHNMPFADAVMELTNSYYSVIPHSFGRNRPPMIGSDERLKKEVDLLESLSDMEIANEIMKDASVTDEKGNVTHPLDRQYAGLGMQEMTPLDNTSNEFKQLRDYLIQSHGYTHHLQLKARTQPPPYRLTLTRLRIAPPEAPVSGYAFGKGIYMADISTKSANYCFAHSSGNIGLLLLCEAELGKPMLELSGGDPSAGAMAKSQGCIATWGKGGTAPRGWKDAGCVREGLRGVLMPDTTQPPGPSGVDGAYLLYNEYIAYDVAQIRLRYLFRVEMK